MSIIVYSTFDIPSIQTSLESPSNQSSCDVIQHLHGDQHLQELQKSPNSQNGTSPMDSNTAQYMRSKLNGTLINMVKRFIALGELKKFPIN